MRAGEKRQRVKTREKREEDGGEGERKMGQRERD